MHFRFLPELKLIEDVIVGAHDAGCSIIPFGEMQRALDLPFVQLVSRLCEVVGGCFMRKRQL